MVTVVEVVEVVDQLGVEVDLATLLTVEQDTKV
jgi:hypothetical protein